MSNTILVQSRITSPSLTPAIFHKWYNTIHIRDILSLPQTTSAFRYISASTPDDESNASGFPYLAIYPNLSAEWMDSPDCGFFKSPLHHEMLPRGGPRDNGEGGFVFDVADFQFGRYEVVGTVGEMEGVGRFLVVVVVDGKEVGEDWEGVVRESRGKLGVKGGSSTLVRIVKGGKEMEGEGGLFVRRAFVALHQTDTKPTDLSEQWGEKPMLYTRIHGFGDTSKVFQ